MNPNPNAALAEAERLLRRDAESLREGHTSHRDRDDWAGEDDAKAGYDEYIRAADALAALTTAAAVPAATRHAENAALLADILNRRPAINAGLVEAYACWTQGVYDLMGAMAAEPANDSSLAAAPKAEPVPAGEYPPLPEPAWFAGPRPYVLAEHAYAPDQMRAYGEACWKHAYKHAAWAQAAPAAVAGADEWREALGKRLIGEMLEADAIATAACRQVAELPDRSSPEDWPEAMLVTHEELHSIVFEAVNAAQSSPQPAVQQGVPSPTTGMTLAQRILHVGGRNNAAGYVEFGSTQAVEALVRQVIRDLPPPAHPAAPAAQGDAEDAARLDFMIEHRAYVVSDPDACPGYWLHFVHKETGRTWVQGDEHTTPRAAIDAARSQAKEGA